MAEILRGWRLVTGFEGEEKEQVSFSTPDSGDGYYQAAKLASERSGLQPNDYRFTYPNGFCILIDKRPFRICIEPILEEQSNPG